jgi:hypothetical protein
MGLNPGRDIEICPDSIRVAKLVLAYACYVIYGFYLPRNLENTYIILFNDALIEKKQTKKT